MNFKYKCLLQSLFSKMPRGEIINYGFQKYVTRSLPISDNFFLDVVNKAYNHYEKFQKYNSLKKNNQKYYEFGAGWDLITPIAMSLLGFEVTCIDIRRLIFNHLISDTLVKFNKNRKDLPFSIDSLNFKEEQHSLDYLKEAFNFSYQAPLDARNTGFNSDYFDFASSTVTMEHIPKQDIYLILKEAHRILKQGGILSMRIDYNDHWSYFDKRISAYNFLQYSEKEWKKYNPSLHYQNRLRHKDYLDIISKTDFEIVEEIPFLPLDSDIKTLKNLNIDKAYKNYSIEELGVKGSGIVLRKSKTVDTKSDKI